MSKKLVIIGASGHGKVIADAKAKELCKYVNDNSLDVVFLGYLKKEELLEIIKHTILVFPSYIL